MVDGDGIGRAFPELQMCTFAIADLPITPIALQDVQRIVLSASLQTA